MADEPNQDATEPENDSLEDQPVPIDEDVLQEEEPIIARRAASAQFVVQSEVGSEAALREAMDPANQSLADALKLSFRVLQIVIVALLLLFIFSGFQSVDIKEGGVMLRWGKIVPSRGATALAPGAHWTIWPYPAGEFVIFEIENRNVQMRKPVSQRGQEMMVEPFWPLVRPGITREEAIDEATLSAINPASGGSLITRDGDIAHLRISAKYDIDNPVKFVQTLSQEDAQKVVALELRRGVVHVMAGSSLEDLIDYPEDIKMRVQTLAQSALDKFGITLSKVTIIEASPPFAIAKVFSQLPTAREEAKAIIQSALEEKVTDLIDIAGESYQLLVELIESYENAENQSDDEEAAKLLAQINTFLDGNEIGGGLKVVIDRARAHDTDIENSLGADLRKFKSILPEYRDNPKLAIDRRWLKAYQTVLGRQDTEMIYASAGVGQILIKIKTLEEISQIRQQLLLKSKMRKTNLASVENRGKYYERAEDYELNSSKPLLKIKDGKVVPRTADDE